jgi:hypothetical protein
MSRKKKTGSHVSANSCISDPKSPTGTAGLDPITTTG